MYSNIVLVSCHVFFLRSFDGVEYSEDLTDVIQRYLRYKALGSGLVNFLFLIVGAKTILSGSIDR